MKEAKPPLAMTCPRCSIDCQRFGKHRNGLRRFRCPQCHKTYTESHRLTLDQMYVSEEKALLGIQLLIEGNSIRSTERITGMDRNTIMKLLVLAGERCEKLMEEKLRNLTVKDVQCDELWAFIGKKEKNKRPEEENDTSIGDSWCFVAIERNTKLVVAWHLGRRTARDTQEFTERIRMATKGRFQLTSDGFKAYPDAVSYSLASALGKSDPLCCAQHNGSWTKPLRGNKPFEPPGQ